MIKKIINKAVSDDTLKLIKTIAELLVQFIDFVMKQEAETIEVKESPGQEKE